jgi:DNA-binding transcriptional ArsR family regulator
VFSALADPTRRHIIERLARGRMTIGEVAVGIPMSQPAISKHVKILEQSGLVQREVSGRVHHLELSPEAMQAASSWIETQRQYWNEALDRLDAYFKRTSKKEREKK